MNDMTQLSAEFFTGPNPDFPTVGCRLHDDDGNVVAEALGLDHAQARMRAERAAIRSVEPTPPTVAEFFDACAAHDWTYNFSDDHSVWKRGEAERKRLMADMKDDPLKVAIFKAWQAHVFSGPAYGTERQPRPVLADIVPPVSTFPGAQPYRHPDQLSLGD